jgi:hypothetical protein
MEDPENDDLETDPPDNNGGGTSPGTDSDARATDPPDNNGGGTTAQ